MANERSRKITSIRKFQALNIGTLMYGVVFVYLVIFLVAALTQKHITYYEVVRGTISGNYRFSALALHQETVVDAERSGQIQYYAREGIKSASGSVVCAIMDSADFRQITYENFDPQEEDLTRIRTLMSTFSMNFTPSNFQKTYDLESGITGALSEVTRDQDDDYISIQNRCYAPESGFVVYELDGFEETVADNLTPAMFNQNNYQVEDLREDSTVHLGDKIYKLITSENWQMYFPLNEKMASELSGIENIRFRFLKDNRDFAAPFRIISNETGFYGEISMSSSLVRYATDRFLNIELILNKKTGLKIPTSSIVDKTFYRIPEEFAIVNEDTAKEITLKVEQFNVDHSSTIRYIAANVYSHSDGFYLINKSLLESGDFLLKEDTAKRFELGDDQVTTLHGVYNINKGYAVFREVTITDQNEEYCIVKDDNIYGLSAYDYIVLNASEVNVDQIIN